MEDTNRTLIRVFPRLRQHARRRKFRIKKFAMRLQRSCLTSARKVLSSSTFNTIVAVVWLCCLIAVVFLLKEPYLNYKRNLRMLKEMEAWKGRFEIDLPGCRIPYVDPHNKVIFKDWFRGDDTSCSQQKRYFLSIEYRENKSCLVLHDDILLLDYGLLPDRTQCTYKIIDVSFDEDIWINQYSYSAPKKLQFDQCFDEPYVWVECDAYKQPLFIAKDVPPRVHYTSVNSVSIPTSRKKLIPKKKFNVLVLGVDAVSRMIFHRLMNSTLKKMQRIYGKNVFELKAFNKVGANSAPNQIPMLTGKRFRHEEHLLHGEYFEEFGSFVWENFSQAGYTTFFAEEQLLYGLFNYPGRSGFRDVPTDYWPRPLAEARDRYRYSKGKYNGCMGNEHVSMSLLKYWIQIQQVSTSPTFSYLWLSEATHDSVTGAKTADSVLSEFLDEIESAGLTQNTVIFFLADHGYRMAPYRASPLGALEDMLPFAFVLLPRSYRSTNPDDVKNLELNHMHLITPYDIHATLMDLAARPRGFRVETTQFGQSLLSSRISPERTCEDAGIDPQYCACYSQKDVDQSSSSVPALQLAGKTFDAVNQVLRDNDPEKKCRIFDKPLVKRVHAMGLAGDEANFKFFKVIVGTSLSRVEFESVFKAENGTYTLLGLPDRLDRYDRNSRCARNTIYEKFCYCV